jgi:hypothetical protein
MKESGAFSMTGTVELGERRSRSVVNGSSEADSLPDLSDLRKF